MSKKLTEKVLKEEEEKLFDAYVDKNGKFLIKESYPYTETDKGMYYVASKELKLPPQNRLVSEFAMKLIDDKRAIMIHKDEWEHFKNSIGKNLLEIFVRRKMYDLPLKIELI